MGVGNDFAPLLGDPQWFSSGGAGNHLEIGERAGNARAGNATDIAINETSFRIAKVG